MKKEKTYRQVYEDVHGPIPENCEIHHKLPKRLGGTDHIENLECLTRKQHAEAHLKLYQIYGDKRDLFANFMLSGEIKMGRRLAASIGGKIGGKITADAGLGFHGASFSQRSEWGRSAGKIGGRKQVENGLGIHTSNTQLRNEWSSLGGIAGPFSNSTFQAMQGSKGGKKNLGAIWITDGKETIKYTTLMQKELSVDMFMQQNPAFRKGRK